ncbi:hypothetical protein HELRODRAFT_167321 [Helobdella robusta]|uniref:Apple domain-containing protein n=1 Tax=Helobdella robusta TaxID=6412 RepID=T1EZ93_HELRO|nr:hypothetical protein HELRODRAFT_167321 [Helobdella robusta]ESO10821.1 hypothetical protein HELRODRAFT_167321 [Helobdella robusta]
MELYTVAFLLSFLGSCFIQGQTINICPPSFTRLLKAHSINGELVSSRNTLQECLDYCEVDAKCLAVDFNPRGTDRCWVHFDESYSKKDNLYDNDPDPSQYIINRTCSEQISMSNSECPSKWTKYPGKTSPSPAYSELELYSIYSCFIYCRSVSNCYGVVYDESLWPPCRMFTRAIDLQPGNLISRPSAIVIAIDDRDYCLVTELDTERGYGRCTGQKFPPPSQWCPSGTLLHIKSKSYGVQPFCCPGSYNSELFPIYNPQLSLINIKVVDPLYDFDIYNCLIDQSCELVAKNFSSPFINEPLCQGRENVSFYMQIAFECSKPVLIPIGNGDSTNAAPSENKAALVLGAIGTAFAIFFLLLLIAFLLYYFVVLRKKSGGNYASGSVRSAYEPPTSSNGGYKREHNDDDGSVRNSAYNFDPSGKDVMEMGDGTETVRSL